MEAVRTERQAGLREQLPSVTLPKGGGAVRSTGEKVSVNPATGTATLGIPIPAPAGRQGFGPELVLGYSSGGGNGPFGLGWGLSVPSITRKTEKGLPRYAEAVGPQEADTLILSGAEDLVLSFRTDPAGWAVESRVAVEEGVEYQVQRFRPRTEGSFLRVERWQHPGTGEVHWRTLSPQNVASLFGRSAACRIADPADPRRVYSWLLEESRDALGNVITYSYKPEDDAGVDREAASDRNRLGPQANRYLKRIRYGNRTSGNAVAPLFEVVFDYGDHDPDAPTPAESREWSCRPDRFSSHRAGFAIRTRRLCRRILVFHRFAELGAEPCLVQSTDLEYTERPDLTYLARVTQRGYIPGRPAESLPPVDLHYTAPALDEQVRTADAPTLARALDGAQVQLVDLDGEGAPGILMEEDGAWHYAPNLGGGRFGAARPLAGRPASANLRGGRQQLLSLTGDGRIQLVQFGGETPGYFARTGQKGGWESLSPFAQLPRIDWHDPNLRFLDLDGDGLADLLLAGEDLFTWYPAHGYEGFGPAQQVRRTGRPDEERAPDLLFAGQAESIFLADMDGDGLTDLVRIRSGEVCYWPNLGYGRFGPKVSMDNSPVFDHPDRFAPSRLRLADLDGSGPTDLLYLGGDRVTCWSNQAGNGWSEGRRLTGFPPTDSLSSVLVADLLGQGTACLVWSSPLPGHASRSLQYLDLTGGRKPHLLAGAVDNMGGETRLEYAPSTRFYFEDLRAGRPWVDRLPFPVHVLVRIERLDHVTATRHVTRYAYHHGYYDGPEREFRGFGAVDQWDAEELGDEAGHLPPVRIRTWFHTGGWPDAARTGRLAGEYWQGDPAGWTLPERCPVFMDDGSPAPPLSPEEEREALRALGGRILRQEVYAEDGSPEAAHPYTVTQYGYDLVCIQPRRAGGLTNRHAVFQPVQREEVTLHYERNPADPRAQHSLVLSRDRYGNVLTSAAVAYARRTPVGPAAAEQAVTSISCTLSRYANAESSPDWYRIGVLWEQVSCELTGLTPPAGRPFTTEEIREGLAAAAWLPPEAEPVDGLLQKRLVEGVRHQFYRDDLSGPLPGGEVGRLGLLHSTRSAASSTGLLADLYGERVTDDLLSENGYLAESFDGQPLWWALSGRLEYDPVRFYLPVAFVDPWSGREEVEYDAYALLVTVTHDALPAPKRNTVRVRANYRLLAPWHLTDANGNRTAIRCDALGRVTATAQMGKAEGAEGDYLDESSPESAPGDQPTSRISYDLQAWRDRGLPCSITTQTRVQHGDPVTPWHTSVLYVDSAGREILIKAQAEPGLAPYRDETGRLARDAEGRPLLRHTTERWTGTGRVVLNNKGLPVRQYEPYFMSDPGFDTEADLVEYGVTPVLHYDPLGRLVWADLPDGTFKRSTFTPWEQVLWDRNDTVAESRWYAERQDLPASDPEGMAAQAALRHAATPLRHHLDPEGRTVVTVVQSGEATFHETRRRLDGAGRLLAVIDPRLNVVFRQRFDLLGRPLWSRSADAGERLSLPDAQGQPLRVWRGERQVRWEYDPLRRPTRQWVQVGTGPERLAHLTIYGEEHPEAEARNLRGQVCRHFDGAGVTAAERYDFKGNLAESGRAVALSYREAPDWSALAGLASLDLIDAAAAPGLRPERFKLLAEYDAMNRTIRHERPDGSVVLPTYSEAGALNAIHLRLPEAAEATSFVTEIEYDAHGQRTAIHYANGVQTAYTYHPLTRRLLRAVTLRLADGATLQDLRYTYDPVGNILLIQDAAKQSLFFQNEVVTPESRYRYDPLYRLIYAEGREHGGQVPAAYPDEGEYPRQPLPHPNDQNALRRYAEEYQYDLSGNITQIRHLSGGTTAWRRRYAYAPDSNRLLATSASGDPDAGPYTRTYDHDPLGNMIQMPHLASLVWDEADRLVRVDLGGGGEAFYGYDSQGQRIWAVVEREGGGLLEERLYPVGGYERFRRFVAGSLRAERQTNHVMDGSHRIALVERDTVRDGSPSSGAPLIRFQLGTHQSSAGIEVDGSGQVLSYEEYYPFGGTAYHSVAGGAEASLKRYRYTGRERDAETGFDYHGARYYAPWLGRWTSPDPAGMVEQSNLYLFVSNQPVNRVEVGGFWSWDPAALADKIEAKISQLEKKALVEDRNVGTSLLNTVTSTVATVASGSTSILRVGTGAAQGVEDIANAEDWTDVVLGGLRIVADTGEVASAALGVAGTGTNAVRTVNAGRIGREANRVRRQRAALQAERARTTNRARRGQLMTQIRQRSEEVGELEARRLAVRAGLEDAGDPRLLNAEGRPRRQGIDQAHTADPPFTKKRTVITEAKGRQDPNWADPADELDQLTTGANEIQGTTAYNLRRLGDASDTGNTVARRILDRINGGSTHESFLVLSDANVGGTTRLYRLTDGPAGAAPSVTPVSGFGSEIFPLVGTAALNIAARAWLEQELTIR